MTESFKENAKKTESPIRIAREEHDYWAFIFCSVDVFFTVLLAHLENLPQPGGGGGFAEIY